jgi:hypothetical protein
VLAAFLTTLASLGLTAWLLQRAMNGEVTPAATLEQVFERNLITTRVILGMILIAGWPILLHAAVGLLDIRFQRPARFLTYLAVLMGGLTYVVSFVPGTTAALLIPVVLAPILFRCLLRLAWAPLARLWAVQLAALAAVLSLALWGIESMASRSVLNPMRELPIIFQLAQRPPLQPQPVLPGAHGQSFPPLRWTSSGSRWLDLRANQTLVQAVNPERSDDWSVTLQAVGKPDNIDRARHGSNPWRSTRFVPEPDVAYVVTIDPAPLPGDLLRVHSLLPMVAP